MNLIYDFHYGYLMLVLVTLFFGLLVALIESSLQRTMLSVIVILLVSIVVGLRDVHIANDTQVYLRIYHTLGDWWMRVEPGFLILNYLFAALQFSDRAFIIALAVVLNGVVFLAYRQINERYALLSFAFFMSSQAFWVTNFQVIRNGIASGLLLFAVSLFMAQRPKTCWAVMFVSVSMHFSTAIVGLSFVLAQNFQRGSRVRNTLFAIPVIFGAIYIYVNIEQIIFLSSWIQRLEAYEVYAETVFSQSRISVQHWPLLALSILVPLFWRRLGTQERALFGFYLLFGAIAFSFWNNILFRDRLFLVAQMIEPILIVALAKIWRPASLSLVCAAITMFLSAYVWIMIWGPSNVLNFRV